jgi:hypothetical protein
MAVDEGYAFVSPKGSVTARGLLEAAKALGLEASVVRSTMGGYYVPVAVSKKYETDALGAKPEEPEAEEAEGKSDFPDETWKNADIKQWAEDQGVDLGDATKKADMLAAISSADTKEE